MKIIIGGEIEGGMSYQMNILAARMFWEGHNIFLLKDLEDEFK